MKQLMQTMQQQAPPLLMKPPDNPKIGDSFKASCDNEQLLTLRSLLETVNASVTRTLLEDNLRKWASATTAAAVAAAAAAAAAKAPPSAADIWEQLAKAQPLPAAVMVNDSEDGDSTVSSTKSSAR